MGIPYVSDAVAALGVRLPAYRANAAAGRELAEVVGNISIPELREADKVERVVVVKPEIFEETLWPAVERIEAVRVL